MAPNAPLPAAVIATQAAQTRTPIQKPGKAAWLLLCGMCLHSLPPQR
eukprot:CAMPEP_0172800216 /NCGR_PEP_ID=MMETSP1075-20121228/2440_1 /TAXON_ID=2916 /ORGANISM="Ceratium fusus, Strain PA161109" /LENGTH=46 /DNA_ID= /DNA_START= /DNA_END= /DNA_ORIENTATION=